jgi:predicted Zn finger-like uncharacterized protein
MSEEKYTRCPNCTTVFRVTPSQLSMRAGRVRCGHCQTVFDGNDNLVSLAALSTDAEDNAERGNAALAASTATRSNEQAPDSTREADNRPRRCEQQSLDSTRAQAIDSTREQAPDSGA